MLLVLVLVLVLVFGLGVLLVLRWCTNAVSTDAFDVSSSLGNATVCSSAADGLLGASESGPNPNAIAFDCVMSSYSSGDRDVCSYDGTDICVDAIPSLSAHGSNPVSFIAMMAAYWRTIGVRLNGTVGGFDGGSKPPPVADTTDFEKVFNLLSPVRILCTLVRSTFSSRC